MGHQLKKLNQLDNDLNSTQFKWLYIFNGYVFSLENLIDEH